MDFLTRRRAIALIGVLGATTASAQTRGADTDRDLNVEQNPVGHDGHGRPPRQPSGRAVQVSLMPVGPSTIRIGQPLRFRMVSTANGFGHLYVLSASGRSQLWLENVPLRRGLPIYYPLRGQTVRAAAPAGDETIIFVASRASIGGFIGNGMTTTPMDLQFTHDDLIKAIDQKFADVPRSSWAFAELKIRVEN